MQFLSFTFTSLFKENLSYYHQNLYFYLPLNHEFNVVLLLFSLDSVQEFLCFHNIPVQVWNAVNDSESYVRASAIHLIGSLACQSQLWTCLLQNSQISEVFLKNFFYQSKSPPLRSNLGRFPICCWSCSLMNCTLDLKRILFD